VVRCNVLFPTATREEMLRIGVRSFPEKDSLQPGPAKTRLAATCGGSFLDTPGTFSAGVLGTFRRTMLA
jgi:hypothetical protein